MKVDAGNGFRHGDHENRQSQRQANPETPGHRRKFGALLFFSTDLLRLEVHAALRAIARPHLLDLRMHGTGIKALITWRYFFLCFFLAQIDLGILFEFMETFFRAEIKSFSFVLGFASSFFLLDVHTAYRIFNCAHGSKPPSISSSPKPAPDLLRNNQ